jgi:hypothetical protein
MQHLFLVRSFSGEIDFDKGTPLLVEAGGRRWRLERGGGLLVGAEVTLSAAVVDFQTLRVLAIELAEPLWAREPVRAGVA